MSYAPMLASPPPNGHAANERLAADLTDTGLWTFEPKYDGVRCTMEVTGEGTMSSPRHWRLFTRKGNKVTHCFPEMEEVADQLHVGVYDGEIIAGPDGGAFSAVSGRIHMTADRAMQEARREQVRFLAFDLIHLRGTDLRRLQHYQRSDALLDATSYIESPLFHAVLPHADGRMLWQIAEQRNLEGLIAKRRDSRYVNGRSPHWLKLKRLRTASLVVIGWEEGEGHRAGRIGALKLAAMDGTTPVEVGKVGTGFTDEDLDHIKTTYIDKDRFFVVEVEYQSYTKGGRLRFPAFKGIRHDQTWHDATIDQLQKESQ